MGSQIIHNNAVPFADDRKQRFPQIFQETFFRSAALVCDAGAWSVQAHHDQVFEKGRGALRWVYPLISNVKAFLLGTYHGLGKKHLQSCFNEFAFRFNRRFWPDQLFPRLVCAMAASDALGYGDLTR